MAECRRKIQGSSKGACCACRSCGMRLLGQSVCSDRIEVQFVGTVAVGGEGRDWSAAGAGSVETFVACRSAAASAVSPVG